MQGNKDNRVVVLRVMRARLLQPIRSPRKMGRENNNTSRLLAPLLHTLAGSVVHYRRGLAWNELSHVVNDDELTLFSYMHSSNAAVHPLSYTQSCTVSVRKT